MKMLLVLVGVLISFSVRAQVLGELTGKGQIHAAYAKFDGSQDLRDSPCDVAMNIRDKGGVFALDFSYFECSKLDIWNDGVFEYKVIDNKLMDAKGNQKGSVLADGTYQFSEKSTTSQIYYENTYDFNCRLLSFNKKTLNLNSVTTYTFKHADDGSWQTHRLTSQDRYALTSKRPYPNCPAQAIPTKLGSTTDLTATVK